MSIYVKLCHCPHRFVDIIQLRLPWDNPKLFPEQYNKSDVLAQSFHHEFKNNYLEIEEIVN